MGTPALKSLLISPEVNASFAERAPEILPGPLSPEDSIEALRVPQWDDWTVEDAVLREVAADCLGYPYFIQLWGEKLWDTGWPRKTVDRQTMDEARTGVDRVRADFYAARYDEFERFALDEGIDTAVVLRAVQRVAPLVAAPNAVLGTPRPASGTGGRGPQPSTSRGG